MEQKQQEKKIELGQYCHCLNIPSTLVGKGKVLGCHIIIHRGEGAEGCGGYITDKMLEAHNPNHYRLKQKGGLNSSQP